MILEYDINGHLGLNILIAIFVVIITGVLGYFIFRSIIKERKKFREEAINYIDGLIQRNELTRQLSKGKENKNQLKDSETIEKNLLLSRNEALFQRLD